MAAAQLWGGFLRLRVLAVEFRARIEFNNCRIAPGVRPAVPDVDEPQASSPLFLSHLIPSHLHHLGQSLVDGTGQSG